MALPIGADVRHSIVMTRILELELFRKWLEQESTGVHGGQDPFIPWSAEPHA
jgi:hypothetical protein